MFLWFCFGIPAVIGLIAGGPLGALLFGLVFGHTARFIAGGIMRTRYTLETIGKFDGDIDTEDLLRFLNDQLDYLHPYFHEWRCAGEGVLSTSFGEKQRSTTTIRIRSDVTNPGHGKMQYVFDTTNNPTALSRIIGMTFFSLFQINEPKHTCLFKTAPILQAAMKYYLESKGGAE
jgi:hypothetical protein